ncbi:Bug family tripartite tricarboxylate transporter substrate binding protein [Roseomonas sp. GCM10028921]
MSVDLTRRCLLGAGAAISLSKPALATFPAQPIRIVVPWNPGGPADIVIRALAPAMAAPLGQPIVIENRPGANGAVGTQAVARAAPDGHTLILANAETHSINPLIYPRLPYNAVTDFRPISLIVHAPCVLLTRPGLGAQTLADFLARVREKPEGTTYASWGIGSTSHLAMEMLCSQAQLRMLHVPFTGGAPASTALVAGQVDAAFLNAGPAEAVARDGKVKILAVGGLQRIALLPEVPTLAELGMPVNAATWFGLLGPARMPESAAERVADAVAEGLKDPAVQALFRAQAVIPEPNRPEEMRAFIASDVASRADLVKGLNIRLE